MFVNVLCAIDLKSTSYCFVVHACLKAWRYDGGVSSSSVDVLYWHYILWGLNFARIFVAKFVEFPPINTLKWKIHEIVLVEIVEMENLRN